MEEIPSLAVVCSYNIHAVIWYGWLAVWDVVFALQKHCCRKPRLIPLEALWQSTHR